MVAFPSNPLPSDTAPVRSLDPLGRELRRPGQDRWAAILPNTAPGQGPYKLQFFGPEGLAGHRAYATSQAAYRAAQRAGYIEPDRGALQRLSRTPAWKVTYDTPAAPPASALLQVRRALAVLARCGVTVETITLGRGAVPPRIVISGSPPVLAWQCYAWGYDDRGRYRRFAATWKAVSWCARCETVSTVHRAEDGRPMPTPPPIDTVTVVCRCGHEAPFDAFWQGPNRYRCPGCGVAWRLAKEGQARLTPSGFVIPPTRRIEHLS